MPSLSVILSGTFLVDIRMIASSAFLKQGSKDYRGFSAFGNESIIIIIIIIIIIMSCRSHGYPRPSLATSPYRSSPLAGL